jgi:hypothetical protein
VKSRSVWLPLVLSNAVLLALVRARVPIAPRWDELVDAAQEPGAAETAIFLEILDAIPEARRTKILLAWFRRTYHSAPMMKLTETVLLRRYPSPELTRAIGGKPEKKVPVAEVELSLGRVTWPKTLASLTPKQRKQLEVMAQGYDNKEIPIAKRFGKGADAHASSLVVREIHNAKGKLAYEMFTWLADDGCVFVAGTTKEVASVVQHSVECDNAALRRALEKTLSQRPRRRASNRARSCALSEA